MILKTERKCTWKEIEVGEVFAWGGCWVILMKISDTDSLFLANDHYFDINDQYIYTSFGDFDCSNFQLYKLPKSVQRLWKEI